ncbi:MAG: hypothetical protein PWP27_1054 [Clostridiales bacterium]|jgi:hypothetical protein|nr:hypothetical protein [Clostridiales bacterium]MDK2933244.1 hypothetical protein [Clostridiales bacterium]
MIICTFISKLLYLKIDLTLCRICINYLLFILVAPDYMTYNSLKFSRVSTKNINILQFAA